MIQQELLPTCLLAVEPPAPDSGIRRKRRPRTHIDAEVEIGGTYDRLTVLRRVQAGKDGCKRYEVRCSCPKTTTFIARGAALLRKNTRSCGCLRDEACIRRGKARLKDISGLRLADGKVEVLSLSPNMKACLVSGKTVLRRQWDCLCHWCGRTFEAMGDVLRKHAISSCGCGGARNKKNRARFRVHDVDGVKLTPREVCAKYRISPAALGRWLARGLTAAQVVEKRRARAAARTSAAPAPTHKATRRGAVPPPPVVAPLSPEQAEQALLAAAEQVEAAPASPWDPEDRARERRERDKLISGFYLRDPDEAPEADLDFDADERAEERPAPRARRRREDMAEPQTTSLDEVRRLVVLYESTTPKLTPEERALRPMTRGECEGGERPCRWLSCKYHLAFDITKAGGLVENFPGVELEDMRHTCALDLADEEEHVLEEVGAAMNVSRERIRQIEAQALRKLEKLRDIGALKELAMG